ncbi:MAG TPA: hypothetical protein ENN33_02165 [Ignavibacteria bacterium]|nr:hypothetical protein [Ignavibacteria bacterium]
MLSNYDTTVVGLFSIAQKLFEGRVLDKKELSEEFGVRSKTIQRDINFRLASLPIVYIRGKGWQLNKPT